MKKASCTTFVTLLQTLHREGIATRAALQADPERYARFWLALKEFCHFALLSRTGGRTPQGEIRPGNTAKIDWLESRGVTTREELETDCMIRIMEKLDLVLCQPPGKQKNYCYAICNHRVNDCFRALPPDDCRILSWDDPLPGHRVAAEEACTYGDLVPDDTYNPERLYLERETVRALQQELRARQRCALARRKADILGEVALLSKRPAEVMVRLGCIYLGLKPRELAALITDLGYESAYARIIFDVSRHNGIDPSRIHAILAGQMGTGETVKADSQQVGQVSGQISRLLYRASKRLSRDRPPED